MRASGFGVIAGALVAVAGLVTALIVLRPDPEVAAIDRGTPSATAEQLEAVSRARVLFAHQSVGADILSAIPRVYEPMGLTPPGRADASAPIAQPAILDIAIGTNGKPLGKIAEFDRLIRSGLGSQLDVAVLKLCYVDLNGGSDVEGVFTAYRATLAGLAADYPDVAFVPATVPVMAASDPFIRAKRLLGRGAEFDAEHNAARHRFNELLRAEFAGRTIFDIAAVEATDASGTMHVYRGPAGEYLALERAYTPDASHLNDVGGAWVATEFLSTVADALPSGR